MEKNDFLLAFVVFFCAYSIFTNNIYMQIIENIKIQNITVIIDRNMLF